MVWWQWPTNGTGLPWVLRRLFYTGGAELDSVWECGTAKERETKLNTHDYYVPAFIVQ